VVLTSRPSADSTLIEYKGLRPVWEESDIAGAPVIRYTDTPWDTLIPRFHELEPQITVTPPVGYLVPQEWTAVIRRLDDHGVRYRRLARAWTDSVEHERIVEWEADARPYEGHFRLTVGPTEMVRRLRTYRPGDLWVPLDQRSALVAIHLFEARGSDALARWNAFDTALQYKEYAERYTMEPLAQRMVREDPALAREFWERVASDSAFAADPYARLSFFYRRSLWADSEQNLIPVGRALRRPPEEVLGN
jgi:hypothetical protein